MRQVLLVVSWSTGVVVVVVALWEGLGVTAHLASYGIRF